jgi:hypothetical protein
MDIAIDFDGTIVKHRFPEIGEEIPFAIETLKLIQSELKHNLILWTVREGEHLQAALDFCKQRGLHFYAVNANYPDLPNTGPRKIMADMFIDDRNFGGLPDWGFIYSSLKNSPGKCFDPDIFHNTPQEAKPAKRGIFRK